MSLNPELSKHRELARLLQSITNYQDTIESPEYRDVVLRGEIGLANRMLIGVEFRLIGDLRRIQIGPCNQMRMFIVTSNKQGGLWTTPEVIVCVPDTLRSDVLARIKPDTQVELKVVCKGTDSIRQTFELLEIIGTSDLLKFPFNVCSGDKNSSCKTNFGCSINNWDICPLCGSKMIRISNVYEALSAGSFKE